MSSPAPASMLRTTRPPISVTSTSPSAVLDSRPRSTPHQTASACWFHSGPTCTPPSSALYRRGPKNTKELITFSCLRSTHICADTRYAHTRGVVHARRREHLSVRPKLHNHHLRRSSQWALYRSICPIPQPH
ncbi:hypothetical protein BKA93DRAFT_788310 [Sparassis latifolia]